MTVAPANSLAWSATAKAAKVAKGGDGGAPRELNVRGAAAYELGMRERGHGIPIQPYPDG